MMSGIFYASTSVYRSKHTTGIEERHIWTSGHTGPHEHPNDPEGDPESLIVLAD